LRWHSVINWRTFIFFKGSSLTRTFMLLQPVNIVKSLVESAFYNSSYPPNAYVMAFYRKFIHIWLPKLNDGYLYEWCREDYPQNQLLCCHLKQNTTTDSLCTTTLPQVYPLISPWHFKIVWSVTISPSMI
jgi:hypothetical protein